MTPPQNLSVKIFADGADKQGILDLCQLDYIEGFTTNPTLMRKSGVTDYEAFARDLLDRINDKPISFEVFSDEFDEMERQALRISQWGQNVYVKIPVTNTRGKFSGPIIRSLSQAGVKLNVTAILTLDQVREVVNSLEDGKPSIVSVFAGRIADTGRDPVPIMRAAKDIVDQSRGAGLLWASCREVLNIFQAEEVGCDIITVPHDILRKLPTVGTDLNEFSLETVRMFYQDAQKAGYQL